jgi:hypothetical protein
MTVFNGAAPSVGTAMSQAQDKPQMWAMAGAKKLSLLSDRDAG